MLRFYKSLIEPKRDILLVNNHFDQIIERKNTSSMKWDKYKDRDIIPMWVADMDFKAPRPVLDSIEKHLDHGVLGYTLVPDELDEVLIKQLKTVYNWQVSKEWIIWLPGVVTALNAACRVFGNPNDTVVSTTPVYPPFLTAPSNSGKILVTIPMTYKKQRACLDFEGIEKEFKKGACLFMLCNPYNPCGTVFTRRELNELVELCASYNVVLCSDEIHSDLVLDKDKQHIPTPCVSKRASQISFSLMAPSKTYNIPGLGCSFAIIPDDGLRNNFKSGLKGIVPSVNIFGLVAAQAAYDSCDDWLKQLIMYLRQNRDMVMERVNRMKGCRLYPIESTYLAWIDVRDTKIEDPVHFFENAGVGLSDGKYFGQEGFIRLNFGCPASVLDEGLRRMEIALEKHPTP